MLLGNLLASAKCQKAMFPSIRGLQALTVSRLPENWRNDGTEVTSDFSVPGLE
jgi:hypothetical protein